MRIVSIHWALESTLRAANGASLFYSAMPYSRLGALTLTPLTGLNFIAGSTKHDNIKEVVQETERALAVRVYFSFYHFRTCFEYTPTCFFV